MGHQTWAGKLAGIGPPQTIVIYAACQGPHSGYLLRVWVLASWMIKLVNSADDVGTAECTNRGAAVELCGATLGSAPGGSWGRPHLQSSSPAPIQGVACVSRPHSNR